jgi:PBSX family phage terminase large subunit
MSALAPMIGTKLQTTKYTSVFAPLPWQVKPWQDKAATLLLTGSAGGGKSRLAAEKVHGYCMKYPGSTWLILRKAREWASRSIVTFYDRTVVARDPRVTFRKAEGAFYYTNGSVVYSGGMMDDRQREAVRSIGGDGGLDGAWMEEANAFTRRDYEEIIGRVRHTAAPWQQIILTTNPDAPTHWIYKDLIQAGGASVYYSGAEDNPNNSPAYLMNLQKMTGVMRDRLLLGKWVQAEGAIYDEFNPAIHMIDADKCPPFVRRFRVHDFGYTNPFVCQWWGMDSDGRLYRYRELYQTRRLVEELTPEIIRYTGSEHIEGDVADHDAEDRATMQKHGIYTFPAEKDVSTGIQAVKARLKVQPDGKPRLYLVRGASVVIDPYLEAEKKPTSTEDEIPGYSWQSYPDGKPNKEQPIKVNDHGCDAMRYLVALVDKPEEWDVIG